MTKVTAEKMMMLYNRMIAHVHLVTLTKRASKIINFECIFETNLF